MLNITQAEMSYILGLLKLLKRDLDQNVDFPVLVELQTINRCNSKCSMCPYSQTIGKQSYASMSDELYDQFLKQLLLEQNFQVLVLAFQNEPFLDKRIIKWAEKFKKALPNKQLQTVTNGSLLTPELIPLVYQYFDLVSISVSAFKKETYNLVMKNLEWETIQRNLDIITKKKEWVDKTIIRFIRQKANQGEAREFKKYWNKRGFRVFGFETNSRLNAIEDYEKIRVQKTFGRILQKKFLRIVGQTIIPACPIPFLSFYVRANGDVVLCFNDYRENNIYGNIKENTIREIFNSDRSKLARSNALNKGLPDYKVCNECDLFKDGIWLTV